MRPVPCNHSLLTSGTHQEEVATMSSLRPRAGNAKRGTNSGRRPNKWTKTNSARRKMTDSAERSETFQCSIEPMKHTKPIYVPCGRSSCSPSSSCSYVSSQSRCQNGLPSPSPCPFCPDKDVGDDRRQLRQRPPMNGPAAQSESHGCGHAPSPKFSDDNHSPCGVSVSSSAIVKTVSSLTLPPKPPATPIEDARSEVSLASRSLSSPLLRGFQRERSRSAQIPSPKVKSNLTLVDRSSALRDVYPNNHYEDKARKSTGPWAMVYCSSLDVKQLHLQPSRQFSHGRLNMHRRPYSAGHLVSKRRAQMDTLASRSSIINSANAYEDCSELLISNSAQESPGISNKGLRASKSICQMPGSHSSQGRLRLERNGLLDHLTCLQSQHANAKPSGSILNTLGLGCSCDNDREIASPKVVARSASFNKTVPDIQTQEADVDKDGQASNKYFSENENSGDLNAARLQGNSMSTTQRVVKPTVRELESGQVVKNVPPILKAATDSEKAPKTVGFGSVGILGTGRSSWEPFWEQCKVCHQSILERPDSFAVKTEEESGRSKSPTLQPPRPPNTTAFQAVLMGSTLQRTDTTESSTPRRVKRDSLVVIYNSPKPEDTGPKLDITQAPRMVEKQKRNSKSEYTNEIFAVKSARFAREPESKRRSERNIIFLQTNAHQHQAETMERDKDRSESSKIAVTTMGHSIQTASPELDESSETKHCCSRSSSFAFDAPEAENKIGNKEKTLPLAEPSNAATTLDYRTYSFIKQKQMNYKACAARGDSEPWGKPRIITTPSHVCIIDAERPKGIDKHVESLLAQTYMRTKSNEWLCESDVNRGQGEEEFCKLSFKNTWRMLFPTALPYGAYHPHKPRKEPDIAITQTEKPSSTASASVSQSMHPECSLPRKKQATQRASVPSKIVSSSAILDRQFTFQIRDKNRGNETLLPEKRTEQTDMFPEYIDYSHEDTDVSEAPTSFFSSYTDFSLENDAVNSQRTFPLIIHGVSKGLSLKQQQQNRLTRSYSYTLPKANIASFQSKNDLPNGKKATDTAQGLQTRNARKSISMHLGDVNSQANMGRFYNNGSAGQDCSGKGRYDFKDNISRGQMNKSKVYQIGNVDRWQKNKGSFGHTEITDMGQRKSFINTEFTEKSQRNKVTFRYTKNDDKSQRNKETFDNKCNADKCLRKRDPFRDRHSGNGDRLQRRSKDTLNYKGRCDKNKNVSKCQLLRSMCRENNTAQRLASTSKNLSGSIGREGPAAANNAKSDKDKSSSEEDDEDESDESDTSTESEDDDEESDESEKEKATEPLTKEMLNEYCRQMKTYGYDSVSSNVTKAISVWNDRFYDQFSRVKP